MLSIPLLEGDKEGQYSGHKNIRFKTPVLRSDLCDHSDVYIIVKGKIDLLPPIVNEHDKAERDVAFKNNSPFRSCISKINKTLIDNAQDLDIAMPAYNLLEYSHNHSMTSEGF